jgi:transposase
MKLTLGGDCRYTVSWHKVRRVTNRATPSQSLHTLTCRNSMDLDPINAAIAAIESRELGESFSYREIAEKFGVVRSTLTRRHKRFIDASQVPYNNRLKVHPQQEKELLQYITRLTECGLPPTRQMIQGFASYIANTDVSMSWVDRFIKRNNNSLLSRWTTGMDRDRHNADSEAKYRLYFELLHGKIAEYGVEPRHTYNMDEKGFLLGITGRSKRIFDRPLYESRQVRQSIQDGSREWISLIACICADGSTIDPALIYRSIAETLQSSWVEEINVNSHRAFITSSTSGWLNNKIGL